MSQDPLQSVKNMKVIEIASSSKDSVSCKNGYLKCQLTQANFRFVEHLLWSAILKTVVLKDKSNTLNAAICQSKQRRR